MEQGDRVLVVGEHAEPMKSSELLKCDLHRMVVPRRRVKISHAMDVTGQFNDRSHGMKMHRMLAVGALALAAVATPTATPTAAQAADQPPAPNLISSPSWESGRSWMNSPWLWRRGWSLWRSCWASRW